MLVTRLRVAGTPRASTNANRVPLISEGRRWRRWKKEANWLFYFLISSGTKTLKHGTEVARLQFIGQRVVRRDLSDLSPPLSPPSLCFETQDGENTCDTSAFVLALCLRFFRRARAAKGALGQSGH